MLRRSLGISLGVALLCCGCADSAVEAPPAAEPIVAAPPTRPASPTAGKESKPEPSPKPKAVAYKPPFPDRESLFDPPKQVARTAVSRQENQTSSVLLLGCANLGSQKAVLSIDGVVTPLEDGAEHAGVRVISVAPPKVVLQRGRARWTESIQ